MSRCLNSFMRILLVWAVLSSCQRELPSHIVAEVDGDRITVAEFMEKFSSLVEDYSTSSSSEEQETLGQLKSALLDQLIEKRLILHEAGKMGITVTDEELQEAFNSIKRGYPEGGFEEVVKGGQIPLPQWREGLRQRLLIEKVIQHASKVTFPIDGVALKRYYEGHREEFVVPEQVRVRQIVVRNRKDAKRIVRRLKRGQPFEELAEKYSGGPEAQEGGDLGFFGRGDMPEEFDVVFSLRAGEISSIVQSPYGYHIFQVVARREGAQLGFVEAREKIRKTIWKEREREAFQDWLARVRENAQIRVNQTALEGIERPTSHGEGQ